MRILIVVVLVLISVRTSIAQNIVFSLKDNKGDLWFSVSDRGIYRYDGKTFARFTGSVGANFITACLYQDKAGNYWFKSNDGGVCKYDGKSFSRFNIPLPDINQLGPEKYRALSVAPIAVSHMLEDKKGNFWFLAGMHGVYRYDPTLAETTGHDKAFTQYYPGNAWPVWPNCILESSRGEILVGSWDQSGLHRFNGNSFEPVGGFSDGMIFFISEDQTGRVWAGTRIGGVDRWDGNMRSDGTAVVTNYSKENGLEINITCSLHDSKGNMWFGTNWNNLGNRGDAFLYDGKTFTNITENEKTIKFLDFGTRSLVEDNNGNIWVGSKNGILLRYDGKVFTDFSKNLN
jgi:ligand-binding sensor domain-containing protein